MHVHCTDVCDSLDSAGCASLAALPQLDHPFVVKLHEVFDDDRCIHLVQEYCSGGELYDRLTQQPDSRFDEAYAADLVHQMLTAIAYCHGMGISHRDLKYVVIVVWLGHWGTVAA